ncbi:TonB family protein [Chitinimonas sp. BJYL2]|uniref:TonB family protein n=1 Tax=Chitinimonas sp. BJYL2 TaxID=2976696 RepID=UPI0022B2F2C4|nr:TonB family protein [Chitinimonas sp. BJYL2]
MRVVIVSTVALTLTSCALGPIDLDPFGRPITPAISMAPRVFTGCIPNQLDRPPELVRGTKPLYPVGRGLANEHGSARLTFTVNEQGQVVDAEAVSKQSPWFENHALIASRGWRFKPAERDGKAIPVRCRISLDFEIL